MQLTKAEEQIMQILWDIKEGTVQDVLQGFEENIPARTTVATVLSVLEDKDFVTHRVEGRSNVYWTLISRKEYSKKQIKSLISNYFDGSFTSMVSFFATESDVSMDEIIRVQKEINELKNKE